MPANQNADKSELSLTPPRKVDPSPSTVLTRDETEDRFDDLKSALEQLHGKKASSRYWRAILYWYMVDFAKVVQAGGRPADWDRFPKDNVDFKQNFNCRFPSQRNSRRTALSSFFEIARNDSLKYGHRSPYRALAFVTIFTRELSRYAVWRSVRGRSRRATRRRCIELGQSQIHPLSKSMIIFLPGHIVEDFEFFSSACASEDAPLDTRKLKNGYAVRYAERTQSGFITMLLQHGGMYGEIEGVHGGASEPLASHYFMTWGSKPSANSIPWRAPRLERFEELYGNAPDARDLGFLIVLEQNSQMDIMAALTLVKGLVKGVWPPTADTPVRLRLRGKLGGPELREVESHVQASIQRSPHVEIMSPAPMHVAVKSSAIVVLTDHPATAFLECARVQHPCIALVRNPRRYTPLMQEYYYHFLEAGILHATVEGMIEFLDQPFESRLDWWEGIRSSVEYRMFRRHFCGLGG